MVLGDYTRGLTGQIELTLLKLESLACHLRTSPRRSISLPILYGKTEEVGACSWRNGHRLACGSF